MPQNVSLTMRLLPREQYLLYLDLHELSTRVPIDDWCVIGGLMTEINLASRNFDFQPQTRDADIVGDILRDELVLRLLSSAVRSLGYGVSPSGWGQEIGTRYVSERTGCYIDILAPDHTARRRDLTTVKSLVAIEAQGADFALATALPVNVEFSEHEAPTTIAVPSLAGALYCKITSHRRIGEIEKPDKHLHDAARLLLVAEPDDFANAPKSLIKRLRWITEELADPTAKGWAGIGDVKARRNAINLAQWAIEASIKA